MAPERASIETKALAAIGELDAKAYWRRLWIVQEIILARKVHLWCGPRNIAWKCLHAGLVNLGHLSQAVQSTDLNKIVSRLYRHSEIERHPDIYTLMNDFKDQQCHDTRDNLYALLSLVSGHNTVVVDYSKSKLEIALDLVFRNWPIWCNCTSIHQQCQEAFSALSRTSNESADPQSGPTLRKVKTKDRALGGDGPSQFAYGKYQSRFNLLCEAFKINVNELVSAFEDMLPGLLTSSVQIQQLLQPRHRNKHLPVPIVTMREWTDLRVKASQGMDPHEFLTYFYPHSYNIWPSELDLVLDLGVLNSMEKFSFDLAPALLVRPSSIDTGYEFIGAFARENEYGGRKESLEWLGYLAEVIPTGRFTQDALPLVFDCWFLLCGASRGYRNTAVLERVDRMPWAGARTSNSAWPVYRVCMETETIQVTKPVHRNHLCQQLRDVFEHLAEEFYDWSYTVSEDHFADGLRYLARCRSPGQSSNQSYISLLCEWATKSQMDQSARGLSNDLPMIGSLWLIDSICFELGRLRRLDRTTASDPDHRDVLASEDFWLLVALESLRLFNSPTFITASDLNALKPWQIRQLYARTDERPHFEVQQDYQSVYEQIRPHFKVWQDYQSIADTLPPVTALTSFSVELSNAMTKKLNGNQSFQMLRDIYVESQLLKDIESLSDDSSCEE